MRRRLTLTQRAPWSKIFYSADGVKEVLSSNISKEIAAACVDSLYLPRWHRHHVQDNRVVMIPACVSLL